MSFDAQRKDARMPGAEQRRHEIESLVEQAGGQKLPVLEGLEALEALIRGLLASHPPRDYEEVKGIIREISLVYMREILAQNKLFEKFYEENVRLTEERIRDVRSGFLRTPEFLTRASHRKWNRRSRYRVVLFIDIAGFGYYNNKLGHTETNRVAFILTHVLQSAMRPGDLITRYNDMGDEFAILLDIGQELNHREIKSMEFAKTVAEKLQRTAWEIDWDTVEVVLAPSTMRHALETALFSEKDLSAGKPIHLRLDQQTREFLRTNPVGLDVATILADVGKPKLGEEEARTPDERRQIISDLLQLASAEMMKYKPKEKKPRPGFVVFGECKVQGTQIGRCNIRPVRT